MLYFSAITANMRYFILVCSLFAVLITKEAKACHGVALVGFSASAGPTSVTVNGSSNSATCGCGPYYLEVQLACFSAANFPLQYRHVPALGTSTRFTVQV